MSRLIFIPQFPTKLRYQEFFFWTFPDELKKHFDEVIVIGQNSYFFDLPIEKDLGMFSPLDFSFKFELDQMEEYINLSLDKDDILLLNDISFPGLFANILYHKRPKKCFAYCHATSLNRYDYFEPDRYSKFKVETGISHLFDKVFVGSNYHKNKLGWDNTVVVGLPVPPFNGFMSEKKYDIISVSRPTMQKVNKKIEKKVERSFGKIVRKTCSSWLEYYQFLSEAKIVLFTGKEDTFGYSIMEAIMNNSIPLAPDNCSYPELLSEEYLYSDIDELNIKISRILFDNDISVPSKLVCQDLCNNFYENISREMK